MRITAIAPSTTRPTYAVSSAPQGTFGATTPMTRLVAPAAATETQRSGWQLPTVRRVSRFARCARLVPLLLLAACGEENASKLPKSLVRKANAGEVALVSSVVPSNGLGVSVADSIATGLDSLLPKAGDTVTDSCPVTTSDEITSLLKDNLLTTIPKNPLNSEQLQYCFLKLKSLKPEAAVPFESKLQGRIVALGLAENSGGGGASGGACDLPGLKPYVYKANEIVARYGQNPNLIPREEFDLDRANSGLYWNTHVLPVFNGIAAVFPEACGLARDAVASLGPVNRPNGEQAFEKAYGIFGPTENLPRWENGIRQTLGIPSPVTP
jgi:hypothetical protein